MTCKLFGILNVTPDSFSDGGKYFAPSAALTHAARLVQEGAYVLDIGASSSHPDASHVTAEQEIERLSPLMPALKQAGYRLSIDSFYTKTQRWALGHQVDWLNDINGFADPRFYDELADAHCNLVVMHAVQSRGIAQRLEVTQDEVWARIFRFFETRLNALTTAGICPSRLVLDPGMGFFLGADAHISAYILARLADLKAAFALPLLVSVSKKSFLRHLTGRDIAEIDPISLAAELWAQQNGADYIRTHNVRQLADALHLYEQLDR